MTVKSNITPTSTLTPLDLLPQSGPVDYFKGRDFAIDDSKNFKQLGSFWTRQLAPEARKHAKALSLTGITTNALTDVQNVKNNLANDSENLYFNNMVLPIEGLLVAKINLSTNNRSFIDVADTAKNLSNQDWSKTKFFIKDAKHSLTEETQIEQLNDSTDLFELKLKIESDPTETQYCYIWKLAKDIKLKSITIEDTILKPLSGFFQFGMWVFVGGPLGVSDTKNLFFFQENWFASDIKPLCSGFYPSNSYFGQSFYKTLFNLEYLPAGPGAKFVADYISGKNQNPVSFEIMLNSIVGLEATIGRNASTVIDINPVSNFADPQPTDQIQKQYIKFEDKVTGDEYQLPCYGDSELTKGKLVPPNTFPQYLVKLYSKPEIDADNFKRVSLHSDDSLPIDLLSGGSLVPKLGTEKEYTGEELKSIIIKDLNAVLIIHLGKISDWVSYHKYMSTRSDYFKYHFPTHNELINYVIRTAKEYTPITYVPLFTCTWDDGNTTDYKYFLYKNS
jgi:hypothetical protein